ncbi:DUF1488 family protein [Methylomarinum sp. Ch1-1]|uniref:DUF1488 family protein n=1 Tax=Methylomarinum roseum TaxID=3067653 RepID=A0AAU7NSE3_9GAMM|nr:DUF1488 family protein [Methylomarinum sp. Ch1-1]MDP4520133.1 DUF1488 family protein [Methylomarinum sp. Ch1-1]
MKLTYPRTADSKNKGVTFPRLECWNAMTEVATVAAEIDRKRVLCRISLKTLNTKFGASEEEPMRLLARHRTIVEEAARNLIENEHYEADGSVLIRANDL